MNVIREGGCLCGAIRFKTEGEPIASSVCHCKLCQRTTGSAFGEEVFFSADAVAFEGMDISTYTYKSPDHGRLMHFDFCPTCGNRLGIRLEKYPDMYAVYAGAYDDPTWVTPNFHVFTESARSWVRFPEGVDCYKDHMVNEDGTPNSPI